MRDLDLTDHSEAAYPDHFVHYTGLELFFLRCNVDEAYHNHGIDIPGLRETLATARDLINAELTRRDLPTTPTGIMMPKGGAL